MSSSLPFTAQDTIISGAMTWSSVSGRGLHQHRHSLLHKQQAPFGLVTQPLFEASSSRPRRYSVDSLRSKFCLPISETRVCQNILGTADCDITGLRIHLLSNIWPSAQDTHSHLPYSLFGADFVDLPFAQLITHRINRLVIVIIAHVGCIILHVPPPFFSRRQ